MKYFKRQDFYFLNSLLELYCKYVYQDILNNCNNPHYLLFYKI
jgi:hypothetical protein